MTSFIHFHYNASILSSSPDPQESSLNPFVAKKRKSLQPQTTAHAPYLTILIQSDDLYSRAPVLQRQKLVFKSNFHVKERGIGASEGKITEKPSVAANRSGTASPAPQNPKTVSTPKKKSARNADANQPTHYSIQYVGGAHCLLGLSPQRGRLCVFMRHRDMSLRRQINEAVTQIKHELQERRQRDQSNDGTDTESVLSEGASTKGSAKKRSKKKKLSKGGAAKKQRAASRKSTSGSDAPQRNALYDFASQFLDSFVSPLEFLQKNHKSMQITLKRSMDSSTQQSQKANAPPPVPPFNVLLWDANHGLYYYSNLVSLRDADPYAAANLAEPIPVAYELEDGDYCIHDMSEQLENDQRQAFLPKMHKLAPKFVHLLKTKIPMQLKQSKILNLLVSDQQFPVNELPNSGLDIDWEKRLSCTHVHNNFVFGTRTSALVVMDRLKVKEMTMANGGNEEVNGKQPPPLQRLNTTQRLNLSVVRQQRGFDSSADEDAQCDLDENTFLGKALRAQLNAQQLDRFEQEKNVLGVDKMLTQDPFAKRHTLQTYVMENSFSLDTDTMWANALHNENFSPANEENDPVPVHMQHQCYSFDVVGPLCEPPVRNSDNEGQTAEAPTPVERTRPKAAPNASLIERKKAMEIELIPQTDKKKKRTRKVSTGK